MAKPGHPPVKRNAQNIWRDLNNLRRLRASLVMFENCEKSASAIQKIDALMGDLRELRVA